MKKIYIAIMIITIVSITLSACAPSFKSMRETDNYLSEQRMKAEQDATYEVRDVTMARVISENTSVLSALRAGLYRPVTALDKTLEILYELPATPRNMNFGAQRSCVLEATVKFNRPAAINRKGSFREEWDLLAEGFANTEKMTSCKVVKARMKNVWGSSATYKGTEGEITVATGFRFDLYLGNPNPAENTCTAKDAKLYVETVLGKVTEKINRQSKTVITAQLN